jgi:hypothetical protein
MLLELMPGVDETKPDAEAEEKPRRRRLGLPRRGGAKPSEKTEGAAKATKKAPAKKASSAGRKKATTAKSSSKED